MNYKFFLSGLRNIIFSPVKAWETIDSENKSVKATRDNFLFPLIILVTISAIAGSLLFTNTELSPVYSIFTGIKWFLVFFVTIYLTSFILGEITFPLDLGKDFSVSFRLIAYSLAPFILCQILSRLFESLLFVNIIGLYGLYIFWTGAEKLLNPPQYKKMPLLIATTITLGVIYVGTSVLLSMLVDKVYYSFFA
ncbi:MAG: YIP1 family protein [Bacteroidales bacterium]|nr:YIP1 family protein [Bacteroidales bacterium]